MGEAELEVHVSVVAALPGLAVVDSLQDEQPWTLEVIAARMASGRSRSQVASAASMAAGRTAITLNYQGWETKRNETERKCFTTSKYQMYPYRKVIKI